MDPSQPPEDPQQLGKGTVSLGAGFVYTRLSVWAGVSDDI